MELTAPYEELNQAVVGYMLNSPLSFENQAVIHDIQTALKQSLGDVVWCLPVDALHITLMDWIAPLVDYRKDKDEIFRDIFESYDVVFENILSSIKTISVAFSEIHVSAGAVYLRGSDNGEFASIRRRFLENVDLIPGTKQPPTIIHTTIARFKNAITLESVQNVVTTQSVSFTQIIDAFLLVRETKIPMLERTVIKNYPLGQ